MSTTAPMNVSITATSASLRLPYPPELPVWSEPLGWSGCVPLPHYGVIRAQGRDAASFLHGQLSSDFALLGLQEARLAAFCNAKGRVQASFMAYKRAADEVLLVCSADLLASTLKRLSLFVLRAQLRLSDASSEWAVWGLVGAALPPDLPQRCWSLWAEDGRTVIRLPSAAGLERALLCQPATAAAPAHATLAPAQWDWLEVRSGVAMVTQPLVEAFVPQMLNYESVGGVDFKKGCYPGQEVVARSQFRGTLKRRTYLAHCAAAGSPGQEVFHAADDEQACGTVLQSAPHPRQGHDLLVSMQVSAADGQPLALGQPSGPALHLLPLPYELLADV